MHHFWWDGYTTDAGPSSICFEGSSSWTGGTETRWFHPEGGVTEEHYRFYGQLDESAKGALASAVVQNLLLRRGWTYSFWMSQFVDGFRDELPDLVDANSFEVVTGWVERELRSALGEAPVPPKVTISTGGEDHFLVLQASGQPRVVVPDFARGLIGLLALKVLDGTPTEPVAWSRVTAAFGSDDRSCDHANELVRAALLRLNDYLRETKNLGPPPAGRPRWIETVKGHGVALTASAKWVAAPELRDLFRPESVYTHNTNPRVLDRGRRSAGRGARRDGDDE